MVIVFTLLSCHHKTEHHGKTPLMQVGSKFLYEEDLRQVLPYGLSGADSVAFVRDYMRKWAEDQVLYEKAELNIRSSERIEQMVNDYRRALIMNSYEQLLIGEKMSEELSEEDLRQYYEENKQLFMLEEPVIKGVFIKAPLSAPGLKVEFVIHFFARFFIQQGEYHDSNDCQNECRQQFIYAEDTADIGFQPVEDDGTGSTYDNTGDSTVSGHTFPVQAHIPG